MEQHTTVARPYAQAVFAHALDQKQLDGWEQLLTCLAVLTQDKGMDVVLDSPQLGATERANCLLQVANDMLAKDTETPSGAANFLRLMASNGRLRALPETARLYALQRAEQQNISQVAIQSARALSASDKDALQQALEQRLGQKVELTVTLAPELFAGVRIQMGSRVIDASLRGRLERLGETLAIPAG